MADSITATDIPPGKFDLVAGYVDGLYKWTDEDWLFHHASRLVRITVLGGNADADVADVENGDLTPTEAADWAGNRVLAGKIPALYFSRSAYGAVHAAIAARGINDQQWTVWAADWTGIPHLLAGTYATQYADPAYGSGGHFDVSVVADYWPGIDPVPTTQPPALPPQPGNPPPDSAPPFQTAPPTAAGGVEGTRSAWANLAALLTEDLPAAIAELLRLLGLSRRTP